ncbi:MAG: hypothetical protein R2789_17970 [Microthrixaceae bacterium]
MQALIDLDTTATIYMVGACADVRQTDKVGVDNVQGYRFNVEGRSNRRTPTTLMRRSTLLALEKYAPETSPRSAATVSFRAGMNLWRS